MSIAVKVEDIPPPPHQGKSFVLLPVFQVI